MNSRNKLIPQKGNESTLTKVMNDLPGRKYFSGDWFTVSSPELLRNFSEICPLIVYEKNRFPDTAIPLCCLEPKWTLLHKTLRVTRITSRHWRTKRALLLIPPPRRTTLAANRRHCAAGRWQAFPSCRVVWTAVWRGRRMQFVNCWGWHEQCYQHVSTSIWCSLRHVPLDSYRKNSRFVGTWFFSDFHPHIALPCNTQHITNIYIYINSNQ